MLDNIADHDEDLLFLCKKGWDIAVSDHVVTRVNARAHDLDKDFSCGSLRQRVVDKFEHIRWTESTVHHCFHCRSRGVH